MSNANSKPTLRCAPGSGPPHPTGDVPVTTSLAHGLPPKSRVPHGLSPALVATEAVAGTPRVGRYEVADRIGSGGMATVHMGRQFGDAGFSRVVAIKRLLPQFGLDSEFEAMFVEEVRLAARIKHPNVVQTLDVVAADGELLLVMDYVHGESLWRLFSVAQEQSKPLPLSIASAIVVDVLHGLHAAHEATDRHGDPLRIVHRDVSPHNVIVGDDGVSRVFDFGIAKAADSAHFTERGTIRGKTTYMAPEQLNGKTASRQTDIFAVGVVLWELLTGRRLFAANGCASFAQQVAGDAPRPSSLNPGVPAELEAVVMKALSRDPARRHANARCMAIELETSCRTATKSEVSSWVRSLAGHTLEERARLAHLLESSGVSVPPPPGSRGARSGPRVEPTGSRYSSGVVEVVRPRAPEVAASPRPVSRARLPVTWKVGLVVLIIVAVVGALAWVGAARALGARPVGMAGSESAAWGEPHTVPMGS